MQLEFGLIGGGPGRTLYNLRGGDVSERAVFLAMIELRVGVSWCDDD